MAKEVTLKKNDSAGKSVSISMTEFGDVLIGRCEKELNRLGVTITGSDKDTMTFELGGIPVAKRPLVNTVLINLMDRGNRKVSHSSHPLTWYDLKQAAGLVHGAKIGDKEAIEVLDFVDPHMEEARAKLGEEIAKPKPKAKPAAKPKAKNQSANSKSGATRRGSRKSKPKKAASLAPSSMSEE